MIDTEDLTAARQPRFIATPEQREAPYADALGRVAGAKASHLMVPGHGGDATGINGRLADFFGERILSLDLPMLIEGLDLAAPGEAKSPYDRALDLAAEAWGAKRAWFVTNGASQANRTAAVAALGLGEHMLSQRSAHSSFSDGAIVTGSVPAYVFPSIDTEHGMAHGVSAEALEQALRESQREGRPANAVYVISPSYFGSVADIRALSEVAHRFGAPLIVDAAWGAHFGFHPGLPEAPTRLGADLVISSTHKLAGSLTQSAMMHLGHGPFAERLEPLVERAFSMTASTSSSALLRASLDLARAALAAGHDQIGRSIECADRFRQMLRDDPRFGVVSDRFQLFDDIVAVDPLRIPIDVSPAGVTGHWMRQRLIETDGVFFEMSTATSVVAVVGVGKEPDFERVYRALVAAVESDDAELVRAASPDRQPFPQLPEPGPMLLTPRAGFFARAEVVPVADAVGRVSADALAAYPPGIPNVLPGEQITADSVAFLRAVAASPAGYVRGAADPAIDTMRVVVSGGE